MGRDVMRAICRTDGGTFTLSAAPITEPCAAASA
jgi:hypothetical protein